MINVTEILYFSTQPWIATGLCLVIVYQVVICTFAITAEMNIKTAENNNPKQAVKLAFRAQSQITNADNCFLIPSV